MVQSTALLALGLAAFASAAPLAPRVNCVSGLYIIVARGSTEAPGEGKLQPVADQIVAAVADSVSVAVDYPATLENYPSSVTAGINDAKQKVEDYVNTCGDSSQIALLGYSQGANVMSDLLAGGVDKPAPLDPSYAQYIIGVGLIADPSFTVGQSFDVGTATKSGIFARGGSSLQLLNEYADIIQDYCAVHDSFCASGDSVAVHRAEVSTYGSDAANFIISQASQ